MNRLCCTALLAGIAVLMPNVAFAAADIAVQSVTAAPTAITGTRTPVTVALTNNGDTTASGYDLTFHLSPAPQVTAFNPTLATQPGPDVMPGQTVTFTYQVPLPDQSDTRTYKTGLPGNYTIGLIADQANKLGESPTTLANNARFGMPTFVSGPAPDFVAVSAGWASQAVAGEVVPVTIDVKNAGVLDAEARAVFYLSTNARITKSDQEIGQIRLAIAAGGELSQVAWVRLPPGLAPATYYLGLWIDPDGELTELSTANNMAVTGASTISPATLAIQNTSLTDALVGVPYVQSFVAIGGDAAYQWSLVGGSLPVGLTLTADGLLSGTAQTSGTFSPIIQVQSGDHIAQTAFTLRAHAPTIPLSVMTDGLPPAVVHQSYQVPLSAAGGTPPYTWTVSRGQLPIGLSLSSNGVLSGKGAGATGATFTVTATDQSGSAATKQLSMRVVGAGDLAIHDTSVPDGTAGQLYSAQLTAMGGLAPYRWVLEAGRLPNGVATSTDNATFTLTGTPIEAGLFTFTMRVEDSSGQADREVYTLQVAPAGVEVLVASLPDAQRGQPYDAQLSSNAQTPTWSVVSGDLPSGLTLTADGHVQGTVATAAAAKTYTFLVQVSDGKGAVGYGGFSVTVLGPATTAPASSGCGQTGSASLLLPLVLGLFLGRRRARSMMLAGLLLTSLNAVAAPSSGPAFVEVNLPYTYQPLTNGTELSFTDPDAGLVQIPLDSVSPAFTVPYFGQQVSTFTVAVDGYLIMGTTTDTSSEPFNSTLPLSTAPSNIVALWWNDLMLDSSSGSSIRWALTGTAPNRTLTVEWNNVVGNADFFFPPPVTFQVQISEDGDLLFAYAPTAGGGFGSYYATIGLQNANGTAGLMGAPCGSNCDVPDISGNKAFLFTRKADLQPSNLSVPSLVYGNIPFRASVNVLNDGATDAPNVAVELYLSPTPTLADGLTPVWTPSPQTIAANKGVTYVTSALTLPIDTPPGTYFPIVLVDPTNSIEQATQTHKTIVGMPIQVGAPGPDLTVTSVSTSATRVNLGDTVTANATVSNVGNLPADCHWRVVLAVGNTVSVSDRVVADGLVSLAPGDMQTVTATFTVPADLQPGAYRVGTILEVDPSHPQAELNAFNNSAVAPGALIVSGPLSIATTTLPTAAVGAKFDFQLQSSGGDGVSLWALANGTHLPAGLTLSPRGEIAGIPTTAGTTQFTVTLSGNQTQSVSATFSLQVLATALPLNVPEATLPSAELEHSYQTQLVATGGVPPYLFTLSGAGSEPVLPPGLAFDPTGIIGGVPTQTGDFVFTVVVADHSGQRTSAELHLSVVSSGRPYVTLTELPDAVVGSMYAASLNATGGIAPYTWALDNAQRLADGTNPTATVDTPPGLTLTSDGTLKGTPTVPGTYTLNVKLTDAGNITVHTNVVLFIRTDASVAILTRQLHTAYVGKAYSEPIIAAGGNGQLTYSLLDENQLLPGGLTLTPSGLIRGTPTKVERRTIVVKVTDTNGLSDMRALTVDVQTPPVSSTSSGCSATATPGVLGLLLLALRRRKPSRALLAGFATAMVVVSLTACSSKKAATTQPCDGVSCQPGETCDPADGLCKCGGTSGRECTELERCNPSTLTCELLDRCTLVACDRGMSCDPADGLCKCGTSNCGPGTLCAPQEKSCVPEDNCAGVTCVAGLTCDPNDGTCKCGGLGGSVCAAGERCDDTMKCVADPCASVSCTGGTTCDPTDGRCHCGAGGDVCLYGQTCNAAQKKCQASTLCATVQCVGGTSCDPADGLCHCGGSSGPVCGASQTCDLQQKACVGGNRCQNTKCPTNMTCDPEDGTCHCGQGGPTCAAQEVCLLNNSGTFGCRTTCDPVSQTPCDMTSACVFDVERQLSLCVRPGTGMSGDLCNDTSDCGRGLVCQVKGFNGYCRPYCARPNGACEDPTNTCQAFDGAPDNLGACAPPR